MTPTPPDRTTEFLSAFNDIEAYLREVLTAKKSDGFSWMANQAARKGLIARDQADDLKEFAELRNAISHSTYHDFTPIADPRADTVAQIKRLRDALLSPTPALAVVEHQQVRIFSPDDDIRAPLRALRESDISQFPVYENGRCVGLLTTNAIARWVAADLGDDGKLDASTVGQALEYAEPRDEAVFLPRTISAAAAVDALTTPFENGGLPHLAVITEHGKNTQRPIAVLAASDIPELLANL